VARFGISSHLFHEARLDREHLVHIAAHGFETVEVCATRSHFDYRDPDAVAALAEWLSDTRLTLHGLRAPLGRARRDGAWVGAYSNASADTARRTEAVDETLAALDVARTVPFAFLVVRPGTFDGNGDDRPDLARRSLETIATRAREVGVQVALEVLPWGLGAPDALADLVEEHLEGLDVGVCLDYGHAHLGGDLTDAVETLSGHVVTTHVHDNRGRQDDHLVPFAGAIDWDAAIMTTQKVGYDGVFVLEPDGGADALDVLRRAERACGELDRRFITF
jgi:sugar phosphate isomerase/epimerase